MNQTQMSGTTFIVVMCMGTLAVESSGSNVRIVETGHMKNETKFGV